MPKVMDTPAVAVDGLLTRTTFKSFVNINPRYKYLSIGNLLIFSTRWEMLLADEEADLQKERKKKVLLIGHENVLNTV